ncbi:DUF1579 domain-containing protein [Sediminibacterium roseum]|uniref:DUF1579 domain-containing protein n=1 Tax=Sediminibacterium roseum TaxID=1978412 RepID=A0ABW9ZY47_9BACT|nr:DUF1579 domain-containing protein [Sediminibacterium roseum]NCI50108.1 DUF1579 domain-containing protein [Sediminibacterium roseum]
MKNIAIAICAVALLFAACKSGTTEPAKTDSTAAATASADNKSEWVPVDSATAMKAMMDAATPGKEHEMLAKMNGNWKAETTMWMAPDGPPMVSTGNVVYKMILGGRYQQMLFSGNMMGAPFEGIGTTGYDNARKVFISSWMDNQSTSVMNLDGTWDEASKTITFTGKMFCAPNGKWCDMKETFRIIDDKNQLMEMWGPDMKTGKPYKNMEIKLTKK